MSNLDDTDEPRAFIVVRTSGETGVHELPAKTDFSIGASGDARIAGAEPEQLVLRWDGHSVNLIRAVNGTFAGGKRCEPGELKPGEELSFGATQVVIGVSVPLSAGGRRALTHHEFRERLYEELSRAIRGGRPTALVMIAANAGEGGRISARALDSFRAGDVVGTYASDQPEFLLPDTDEPTARMVSERILEREGVEAAVGVAVAPDHGDSPERVLRAARQALREALRAGGGVHAPPARDESEHAGGAHVDAHDPATLAVLEEVADAAADDAAVLITGEKSAGKSAFARALHARRDGAGHFVSVNCAALEDDDAAQAVRDAVAAAAGGSLFLDEVGELSEVGQAELDECLDGLVGARVKLIATTHRALGALVERDAFSRSVWEALSAHVLEVPPLRARPEDILPLAERFAREAGAAGPVRISAGAVARLRSYPWPGNVLELRNAMDRAVLIAGDGDILAEHLPSEPMPITASDGRLREHVDGVERDAIIKALADSNHNQTHAAKRLGISRRALIYKMEKYGLKRPPKSARRK